MEQPWRVEMLGRLRAVRGECVVERFRTQKTASLLAYLAYHLGREHPRDELIEILWPEDDRDTGRHKLSVALSSLRAQLEPPGVADGSVLITGRLTAALCAKAVSTDVAAVELSLRAAGHAQNGTARLGSLTAVLDGYGGKLLPGFYEDWIFPEQERLTGAVLQAVRELAECAEVAGDLAAARESALRGLRIDAECEDLHALVIRLCEQSGQHAAAARHRTALARLMEGVSLVERGRRNGVAGRGVTRPQAPAPAKQAALEPVGGAVRLGSPFYIERSADRELHAAVARGDSIVLLKGAAQTGKSSLLARALQQARAEGSRVIRTEFHTLNASRFGGADVLLETLAEGFSEQLELPGRGARLSDELGGPNIAFRRFLKRDVLCRSEEPLVWGMEGVDRLFGCPFGEEVFELFRSLHNERAFDPEGPWQRLTLVIAYATEAHLFITDLNRSPFNVGTRLQIEDFSREQVEELNVRCGAPLPPADCRALFTLLDGHPYLVRCALQAASGGASLRSLEEQALREDGPFGEHLRRIRALVEGDPATAEAVKSVLQRKPVDSRAFYRLRSAGLLKGESAAEPRMRCPLYERSLRPVVA
jgi:DNA-binding SARP family transcriptional activator